jgi:hypothetical protein
LYNPRVDSFITKKADIMKLSSVLLSLLLAPAALVHAKGGNGGKKGKKEMFAWQWLDYPGQIAKR